MELTLYSNNGYNETFVLVDDDEISDQVYVQGLLVAHPRLINITYANMTYYKYKGWIYSGLESWTIDKVEINFRIQSNHKIFTKSFCGRKQFNDTASMTFILQPRNCTLIYHDDQQFINDKLITSTSTLTSPKKGKQQRIARLFWQWIAVPSTSSNDRNDNQNNQNTKRWWELLDQQKNQFYIWSPLW